MPKQTQGMMGQEPPPPPTGAPSAGELLAFPPSHWLSSWKHHRSCSSQTDCATGGDDQSRELMSSWDSSGVSAAAQSCCVAIRVDAESETCVQFSQIYPVVCIPSSFFIGENGIPLEVIAGSVTEDELKRRISRVVQMHAQQMEGPQTDSETPDQTPQEALNVTSSDSSSTASKESLSAAPAVEEGGGASGHVTTGEDTDDTPAADEPLDARVERLTKKLEERREQKKKTEEETQVQREAERRRLGKEMLEFKRRQEEQETRRLLQERERERMEERAARERVKQQIALDRADRAARYAQSQQQTEARVSALQTEQETRRETAQRERSAFTRIQFRLPDGSSFTNQFSSETRLQEARDFAAQEVGSRYGRFALATMFPRREFTDGDMENTLLELELTPSASIVLLPQAGGVSAAVVRSSSGGVWAVFSSLLSPLLAVWRLISGLLFSAAPLPRPPPAQTQQTTSAPASGPGPQRDAVRKRALEKRPDDFKKDGKIYRLRTQEDTEDDNNTWNGNSTQQM